MTRGFEAINTVTIDAPQADVWDALTNPAKVKEYLHGTEMSTDWKEGSPIYWRGEWKGKPYEDKGKVLEVKPQRLLKYTHWSPLGGSEDKPENYHTVVYELAGRWKDDPDTAPGQQSKPGRGRKDGQEQLGARARGSQGDRRKQAGVASRSVSHKRFDSQPTLTARTCDPQPLGSA